MSEDIGKGDLVECVYARNHSELTRGAIYTVHGVHHEVCFCPFMLSLEEVNNKPLLRVFCGLLFRKINRGPPGMFNHLLDVDPSLTPELEDA